MSRGRTRLAGLMVVLVLGAVGLSTGTASAATGSVLPPGSTVCTDHLRSDAGAYVYGLSYTRQPLTWSIRMSSSPGGAETVLFETTDWEVIESAEPATPGDYYYRDCVTNTSDSEAIFRLSAPQGPDAVSYELGIGPHTATLGPGGAFCGEFAFEAAHFTGTSNVPVEWHVRALDQDSLEEVADLLTVTATSVAQAVASPGYAIDACVTNTSTGTATLSFELTEAAG